MKGFIASKPVHVPLRMGCIQVMKTQEGVAVKPGSGEVLLGAIPLEDMDLIVDPRQVLTGAHSDGIVCLVK